MFCFAASCEPVLWQMVQRACRRQCVLRLAGNLVWILCAEQILNVWSNKLKSTAEGSWQACRIMVASTLQHGVHRHCLSAAFWSALQHDIARHCHPNAHLAATAAAFVFVILVRKSLSKFSASMLGGPASIILRI